MNHIEQLRKHFLELVITHGFQNQEVEVRVKTLTPEESIGNPEHDDYPLTKGRERMMEALFMGSRGQAFTDMFGNFSGSMTEALELYPSNNFRRAIFLSSLNALSRHLGIVDKTIHCKDDKPPQCAKELASMMKKNYGQARVAIVGLQPRMVEALSPEFEIRVTDMDSENIGKSKFGATIQGPEQTPDNLEWCDVALVTGTTLTNSTLSDIMKDKTTILYGVTCAAASHFLNIKRFCPYGT